MPNPSAGDDLVGCYQQLNQLYAYMQGHHARVNVLRTILQIAEYDSLISDAREMLDKLSTLLNDICAGNSLSARSNPLFNGLAILRDGAIADYTNSALSIERLLANKAMSYEEAVDLVSYLAHHAYSHDNYIQGLIRFGEVFNEPTVADRWRQRLLITRADIQKVHAFLQLIEDRANYSTELMSDIQKTSQHLPALVRAKSIELSDTNKRI